MKQIILLALFGAHFTSFAQIQIGPDIDGEGAEDEFGISVSLNTDGSVMAIGGLYNNDNGSDSGHVRIYQKVADTWLQIGQDINGEAAFDRSGTAVSLSDDGSIVAIGAPWNDGNGVESGQVRVFQNVAGDWLQIGQDIDGEAAGDQMGFSISLNADGTMLAIGSLFNSDNGLYAGQARVYQYSAGLWSQIGQDIDGDASRDLFGRSISINADGSIVAIGANGNDANGDGSGQVRIYKNIAGSWTQIGQNLQGDGINIDFGGAVSLSADGNLVAIGAQASDANGLDSGHVEVYQNIANNWIQVGEDIVGEVAGERAGYTVSLTDDGSKLAIGAPYNSENGHERGQVRIYQNDSGTWSQLLMDINGEAIEDYSGLGLSLSGDGSLLGIGATYNDGNGDKSGQVRVYDVSDILSTINTAPPDFSIFPNPTTKVFTVHLDSNEMVRYINLYNNLGQWINTYYDLNIDVSGLNKGVYIVEVVTFNGSTTKKLVVH